MAPIIRLTLRSAFSNGARPARRVFGLPRIRNVATHTYNHHAQLLSVLPTNVDKTSSDYRENAAQMDEVLARMRDLHVKIEAGGSAKAKEKHLARGKMMPRE